MTVHPQLPFRCGEGRNEYGLDRYWHSLDNTFFDPPRGTWLPNAYGCSLLPPEHDRIDVGGKQVSALRAIGFKGKS
jgi:hypothetical protein